MRIYFTRHAQSEWQINPNDDWDSSLTTIGHQQAQRLAYWLSRCPNLSNEKSVRIMSVYASPLKRAQETASYVAKSLGLTVNTHDSLSEAKFHVASYLPQYDDPLSTRISFTPLMKYQDLKSQAGEALQVLVKQAEICNGSVMAVAHGGIIKTILRLIVGSDTVCFRLYNTSLNLIEWRRGRWHLVHLNLWDHLETDLRTE